MHPNDHAVTAYARDVVEGRTVAGRLVGLACARHLDDLERGADRGLTFDPAAASMVIKFAGTLQHTSGAFAGRPLSLQPWQKFRLGSVYGWKRADGMRRFRTAYNQVGKKNGKTTETVIPAIYSQILDGEGAPETYCAATTNNQARILFNAIRRTIKRNPLVGQLMRVQAHDILTPGNDGVIKPLSRDSESQDGFSPSFLARDELHRWTDRELAETLVESQAARAQPIDWIITTAGHDRGSICGEMRTYAESVLRGDVEDDEFFAYVAEPPEDGDPEDPDILAMGNPNIGVSKTLDYLLARYRKAQAMPAAMANFRRFHMNLWTETAEAWIGRDAWDAGQMADQLDIEDLAGRPAFAAIDLSRTTDMTAVALAVPMDDGKVAVKVWHFIPEGPKGFAARAQAEKKEYLAWSKAGWLEVHRGGIIDQAEVAKRLHWIRDRFQLREVAFDPWGMRDLTQQLERERFPLVEHRQGFKSFSAPMKRVEALVVEKQLRHGGDPVLAWQVGNVHQDTDPADNVKPNKRKSQGRIDGAVAVIMAVGRAAYSEQKRKAREVTLV